MARGRHVFVSKDGMPLPEWTKLPGYVACHDVSDMQLSLPLPFDVIWIRLVHAESGCRLNMELLRQVSTLAHTVVMSDLPDESQALEAFQAGARGYCNSHSNRKILSLIARVVQEGGLWIGESLMQRIVTGVSAYQLKHAKSDQGDVLATLTAREREVAKTIASGASNKLVARQLGISERTVKAHVSAIFNKLDVKDRLSLSIKINNLG